MKKLSFLLVVAILATGLSVTSCKKDIEKTYANFVSGEFIPNDGIGLLKSAPAVGGHEFSVYKQGTPWALVDGTEFIPGSAPALDWGRPGVNPIWLGGAVYITYCPTIPLRVIIKATTGGVGTEVSYLGIHDCTPTAASFPITVSDKRLGDKLYLNTDALTSLPGYTNLTFAISYDKSVIDINQTAMTSPVTDGAAWPVYVYSGVVPVVDQMVTGAGDVAVYDGLDSKITGTITLKITVDGTTITKTTPAPPVGTGLNIRLTTTKHGFYDSGVLSITEDDITMDFIDIDI